MGNILIQFSNVTQYSKQDILTRPSLRRTVWRDWLDAEYVLTWGTSWRQKCHIKTKKPFCSCVSKTHQ